MKELREQLSSDGIRKEIKNCINPLELLKLAYFVVAMSFWYLFAVTFIPLPETGQDNAKYIVGFLVGTGLTSILAFYFRRVNNPDEPPPRSVLGRATDNPENKP